VSVRCGTGLSGAPRCQSSNGRNHQNPNSWVTWLAHRTVWCAHRQIASPTVELVVGAINTPQPPPLQASKFFRHLIQYKSWCNQYKTQFNRIKASLSPKIHSKQIVTRESVLLVFFELLFLDHFLLPHSCSSSTCNQSKRHQIVWWSLWGLSDPVD
jgi:hypothetical protein